MHRVSKTFGLALCLFIAGFAVSSHAVELPPAALDTAPARQAAVRPRCWLADVFGECNWYSNM